MGIKTKLERLERELNARAAAAEPLVISIVWHDEATGEDEPAGAVVVDGRVPAKVIDYRLGLTAPEEAPARVIQLRWPEDEDDEKRTRQDDAGRA